MENEDLNLEIDLDEEVENEEETPEVKPKESNEAKLARLERQSAQLKKKMGIEEKPAKKEVSKDGLDRIDKMVLRSEGIKSEDEMSLVEEFMKDTGKDVESVIESRAFKAELKALREEKATEDALPRGTKRSSNSSKSNVEYWLAKGELPPASEVQLRREVVNAKMKQIESRSQFSDTPII